MANQGQLAILRQGNVFWNAWQKNNPGVSIDLSGAHLSGRLLSGVCLTRANLCEATLIEANLTGADLSKADLSRVRLERADLSGADLSQASLHEAKLCAARLNKADLSKACLNGADLSQANLRGAELNDADLLGANLYKAYLGGANLYRADLNGANLSGATFRVARLLSTIITNATLTGAKLYGIARDDWQINGIKCDYVYWDVRGKQRTPKNRNFRPGEFEELYKALPTFEYYFEHGFTPLDTIVMDRVVQAINEQHPNMSLRLKNFEVTGTPHATFTVLQADHVEAARQQVSATYEQRIVALEAQKEQLMDVIKMLGSGGVTLQRLPGGVAVTQPLSSDLLRQAVDFLVSLPNLDAEDARRAFVAGAGLDPALRQQVQVGGPPRQWAQLLAQTAASYGQQADGRLAAAALLEAAKGLVGNDRQAECERLIGRIEDEYAHQHVSA